MEINLSEPKDIIVQEEKRQTISKVTRRAFTDYGTRVEATVEIGEPNVLGESPTKTMILWEGQSYIDIGQYTDDQVNARIVQLLSQ